MFYYDDFQQATNKLEFIQKTINQFKGTKEYNSMLTARAYYRGENKEILKRLQWFYNANGGLEQDKFKANNQTPSEFFPKIIKQENSYLLSNGVTITGDFKKDLGSKFDNKIFKSGSNALIDGVCYLYCFLDNNGLFDFELFKGTELIPLFDRKTGLMVGAIRFIETGAKDPIYIEFYEIDGKTEYIIVDNEVRITKDKESYIKQVFKSKVDSLIVGGRNFSKLPIIPMYGNELKTSSLNVALKNKIDLYDIIMSDFGNNLEDCQDVYWVIKNYGGQDLGEFLEDYKKYKSIKVDAEGDATSHTIEVPFQARQTALDILRKAIYEGAMALDTSILNGGSITNVVIKAMMSDLDLKTDIFEMNVLESLEDLISLYFEYTNNREEYEIKLIRRGLVNDTELVDNLMKMRSEISRETFLELNPYIENAEKELDRLDNDDTFKYNNGGSNI